MVIGALLKEGTSRLLEAGIENPRLDSEVLLADVLRKDRMFLLIHRDDVVPAETENRFRELIDRRAGNEPVAYLVGKREFMSLTFQVGPGVLIPRPDTETLVEFVLERLKDKKTVRILDLCTGSGAIAVSLAYYLKESFVTAVDISETCVIAAQNNAEKNGVADRVTVRKEDIFWLTPDETYDCVVSNPPYIPSDVVKTLERDVRDFEPKTALDGGADGLDFYRYLVKLSDKLLLPGGLFALEVGHDQAETVQALLEQAGTFEKTGTCRDLAGIKRVVYGEKINGRA